MHWDQSDFLVEEKTKTKIQPTTMQSGELSGWKLECVEFLLPSLWNDVARKIAGDRKLLPRSAVDNVHLIWWRRDCVTRITAITAAPRIVADVVADWGTKEHVARKVSLLPEKFGVFRQRNYGPMSR